MLFLAQADQAGSAIARKTLDARAELQAVADFYQALADEQGVTLMCEGHGQISADPQLLRRALSNLLSNALKYTPRGGSITLRAGSGPDRAYLLSVSDSGLGISAAHLPKLGDRFYRVDASRTDSATSAGLGLAIVKSIMALHRGSLSIASTEGKGTTATLLFAADGSL
jgi:two-component system heavy metal sensor histidine kinase CusS